MLGRKIKPGRVIGSMWQGCSLIWWSAPSEQRSGGKEGALRTWWGGERPRQRAQESTMPAVLEEQPGSQWPLQLGFSLSCGDLRRMVGMMCPLSAGCREGR